MSAIKIDLAFTKTFDTPAQAEKAVEAWVAPIVAKHPNKIVCRYFICSTEEKDNRTGAVSIKYGVMLFSLNDDITCITTMALRSGFNVMN